MLARNILMPSPCFEILKQAPAVPRLSSSTSILLRNSSLVSLQHDSRYQGLCQEGGHLSQGNTLSALACRFDRIHKSAHYRLRFSDRTWGEVVLGRCRQGLPSLRLRQILAQRSCQRLRAYHCEEWPLDQGSPCESDANQKRGR